LKIKDVYEFGIFRFDSANRLLLRDGAPVALTPKAFDLLLVLVQNGSQLTTKEELMRRVWPKNIVEEANVTVNISALRRILGETADGRPYIETVPKKGYRFVAPVVEVPEVPKEMATATSNEPRGVLCPPPSPAADSDVVSPNAPINSQPPARENVWRRFGAARTLGLLSVFVFAASFLLYHGPLLRSAPSGQLRSLAVLPFQNLRPNAENAFLEFSLADAVITKLGYVSELAVRPSYAVQKYKAQPIDIGRVASDLNVNTLLTGTFLRDGDDLRINCQLVDVKTENILWKGGFDLKYEKLLTVQDSVANQIISGLELTLSSMEAARLKRVETISPLAYEYYLRGIDLYSTNDFPMAIKMLERSTELAPEYALTWANLGKSYTASASFQLGGGEQYLKAQKAFERALALQADQIDARIYLANLFTDTGRVEKAVPLLRQALKTNPNHAEIHWELGYAYRFAGMLRESVLESENARRLDPGVKLNSSTLNGYLYLGQYGAFLASLPKTNDFALIEFYRGFAKYYLKDWQDAAKHFDRALELEPSLLHAQIGKALGLGIRHRPSEGLAVLLDVERKINQRAAGDPEAVYKIAQAYAVLGDRPSALRVFKRAIDGGFFPYPYLLTDPLLDNLRSEPEFGQLVNAALQRRQAFIKTFFL
jgi:DNA-binding winged helix-turn-helix (wHTH) protein/TolB-like protein